MDGSTAQIGEIDGQAFSNREVNLQCELVAREALNGQLDDHREEESQ